MVPITKHGILLEKRSFEFEAEGVLNPAVIEHDGLIHMFYRAVASKNVSSIGYCKLDGPMTIVDRYDFPVLTSEFEYEDQGIEDPRIVRIDDRFYLTYSAYDGYNAFGCLAISKDLVNFKKKGIIVPQWSGDRLRDAICNNESINSKYFQPDKGRQLVWDKNVMFFPRRINGKLCYLHRIRPGIQIVKISELSEIDDAFWVRYMSDFTRQIVMDPKFEHELSYLGGGCPPIETESGWLLIYHGVRDTVDGYSYSACAALLELDNPENEIARLPYPLFEPDQDWEKNGYVKSVCFPTGTAIINDTLYVYYGAADERIACASMSLSLLVDELNAQVKKN